jgi:hypothetical protein
MRSEITTHTSVFHSSHSAQRLVRSEAESFTSTFAVTDTDQFIYEFNPEKE